MHPTRHPIRSTGAVRSFFVPALLTAAIASAAHGQLGGAEQSPERPVRATDHPPGPAGLVTAGPGADSPFALILGETRFDPALVDWDAGPPFAPAEWARAAAADGGPGLRLVQLDGPTRQATLELVKACGLEIVQHIHPHAYVTWGSPEALAMAEDVPGVRCCGGFVPAFKVLPHLRDLGPAIRDVDAIVYHGDGRGADVDAVIETLRGQGVVIRGRRVLDRRFEILGLTMRGDGLEQAAAIPGIYSLQPVRDDGGLRGEMTGMINLRDTEGFVGPGYEDWLDGLLDGEGLDGAGVVIANVDSGVQEGHPDLIDRFLACIGTTCSTTSSNHGTHTAGIMAGDGSSGATDAGGFLRGLGVAPRANLVEQQYSPWFTDPGGMLLLMRDSHANGAQLSGNSWGPSGFPQGYDDDTMQVDIGVRDVDPDTPGDQPLTYVLSFMNGFGGFQSQGTPDEAKNVFTIGSTKAQTDGGSQIPEINDLSANTAHGPALDGRTIPHMVAPGCEVDSSVVGGGHDLLCGTSMASPQVSGAIALFIERWRATGGDGAGSGEVADPSPAMVKAAFLPVALSLDGHLDADGSVLGHPFDSKQGWGRMDVDAVLDPEPGSVRYWDVPQVFDETGEEWSAVVSPLDPSRPMRIMLVWTDAPGHGLGGSTPAWNNDLDLVVEADETYLGNVFGPDGFSVPGGDADDRNNTEGAFLGPVAPSTVTIRVVAADINSDGLPNGGDETDQDFAVACYNCAVEPGFTVSVRPGDAEVCAPAALVLPVEVESILGFAEPVTLEVPELPAGTTASFSENPVAPPATVTMTLDFGGGVMDGSFDLEVRGEAAALTASDVVELALAAGPPGPVTLLEPENGATEVPIQPMLSWEAIDGATGYVVTVAGDPSFAEPVEEFETQATEVQLTAILDPLGTYFWRVAALNPCGESTGGEVRSFTLIDSPPILLVDDDDNGPDVRPSYTDLLDGLGLTYDVWDTGNSDDEPDAATLAQYRLVIWFTGDEFGGACGPGPAGENALSEFLEGTGCLLVSSQDYEYDRGLTPFMSAYLGAASITADVGQSEITGTGEVFGDLGSMSLDYPFFDFADALVPGAGAEIALVGSDGNAAVTKAGPTYRTAFLTFPVEAIAGPTDASNVVVRFVEWCEELTGPDCPADLAGDDGAVTVEDLLALLGGWGGSGPGASLAEPLDVVDTADLLALLAAWGPCE